MVKRNPVALLTGAIPILLMALSTLFGAEFAPDTAAQITLGIGAVGAVAGSVAAAGQVMNRDRSTVIVVAGLIPAGIAAFNLFLTWLHPEASPLPPEVAAQLQLLVQAAATLFTRQQVTPAAGVTDSAAVLGATTPPVDPGL